MSATARKREVGRGERLLPGVWRLRLPLPWPGVPHCNAWAVARGDGIVLVDTGLHEPGSFAHLERAMAQVNLRVDLVREVVCTHAHADHYGQAATLVERTGCDVWLHPDHEHMLASERDPAAALARLVEVARRSGVPESAVAEYEAARGGQPSGVAGVVPDPRALLPGVVVDTDLGTWSVHATPGHAPSHVCLFQAERRMLISGDHLLGRISLYYDFGFSPDPVGEYLASLDVVERLDARLALSGHGRTFTDVQAHIEANRRTVHERLDRLEAVVRTGALTAFEAVPRLHDAAVTAQNATWWLTETLCYLRHLELAGRVERIPGDDDPAHQRRRAPERWSSAA